MGFLTVTRSKAREDHGSHAFSGHLNHFNVDFVMEALPADIKQTLHAALSADPTISPSRVSSILNASVLQIDNTLTSQFLDLFPRDLGSLNLLDDSDIQSKLHREGQCTHSYDIAARSLGGTALVLSLTDSRKNLWIVNLGGKLLKGLK